MKVLVTGGGGMVASHLIDLLIEQKEEVIASYRWNEALDRISHSKDKIKMVPANLLDLSSLFRLLADNKPDAIWHGAAESFVNDSFTNPLISIETNTLGTANLLEAVRLVKDYVDKEWNPKIVVVSSSEYYGKVDADKIPITEEHPPIPGNPYAVGKCGADLCAQFYAGYFGLDVVRSRLFTHTSGRRTMESAEVNFANQIAKIEKNLQEPVIKHGNLHSMRAWAHCKDACRAYHILLKEGKKGEVYNIAGNTQKTIGEMLDYMISMSTVKNIRKEVDPKLIRKIDVNLQVPSCEKFTELTGWKPEISFEETIKDVLEGARGRLK